MRRWMLLLLVLLLALTCVQALADPEAVPEDEFGNLLVDDDSLMIRAGDESGDVLAVQIRLTELCYYTGSLTGHMGEATQAAVQAFQRDFGLEATGNVDAATFDLMMGDVYRPLNYGMSGDDVKRLQLRLTQLGYFSKAVSGNYLGSTADAVAAFQTKMGEEPTGKADGNTLALLFGADARTSKQSALEPKVTPTPRPDGVTPAPTSGYERVLKRGMSGDDVKKVQQRLTDLCYYAGSVSGNYGDQTVNAVKRFQMQNGLGADGIIGKQTWDVLFSSGIVPPDATAKPTPVPTPKPKPSFYIVVDVTNQVTTVYTKDEHDEYTVIVRQMLCSTGTKSNPSDVGNWKLSGRKAQWCYFPAWGSHARYWTKINDSIAFHSVIYNTVNLMDLSVKSYKHLGTRASHGCIRLTVNDAKWIYDNIPAGTIVNITEKLPADPELRASLKLADLNTKTMTPYTTPQPTAEPIYISGAQPPMPLKELKKNDSSEAVFWLQKKLTELGYYHGKCSGTYLGGTVDAVKAFQKANGLKQTGKADVKTLQLIYKDELATPTPAPQTTPRH